MTSSPLYPVFGRWGYVEGRKGGWEERKKRGREGNREAGRS